MVWQGMLRIAEADGAVLVWKDGWEFWGTCAQRAGKVR